MRAADSPVILLSDPLSDEQEAAILAVVPGARLVSGEELAAEPSLAGRIEICYHALPARLWPEARSLRWLQTRQAGVEWLARTPEAAAHPAVITNVHIHAAAVSEHLWAMCLALTRRLGSAVLQQEKQAWDRDSLVRGISTLEGKTACILGLGVIGRRCARLARAFGMRVIGIRRRPGSSDLEPGVVDEVGGPADLLGALARSRVVMAVLPETAATRGLIGRPEMQAMKGAYLLNAGRGSCLDTDALVEALQAGQVRGAGLDVTDPEPLPQGHPLWAMPNVIITPHYAGDHPGYYKEAFEVFLDNLGRYMRGEPLVNVVDRERGY